MAKITIEELSDSLKEYLNDPCISIKDFGAKGDCKYEDRADCIPNGTDDTISFQNAVDFCILNNKTLVIPPGEYLLTDTITVNGNLTIKGGGMNKTKLIFYLLDKNKNGIEVSGCSDVWSDFSLYCAGYLGKAGIMFGTEQNNADNQSMRLEKIQCNTFRYGISTLMPETMNRIVFDHCQFISNLIAGIYIKSFEGNDFGHSCPLTFFNCICNANGFDPSWMKNFTYQGINILDDVDKLSYQVYIKGSTNLVWYGGQISNHGNNKNTAMVYLDTINGATFDYLDFEDFKSDAVYSENGEPVSEVLGLCEGAAFVAFRVRSMNINLRSLHAINSPVLIKLVQCYDVNNINFIKDASSYFKYSVHASGMCWMQGKNGNEGYIYTHSDIQNFNEEALSLVQSGNKCNLSKSYNNSLLKPKFGNIVEDFNFDYIYKIDINGENPSEGNTYHVNYVGGDINNPDLSKSCYVEKEVYKPYNIIGNIYSLVNNYDPDVKFFVAQYQGEHLVHIDYISTKGDFDLKHDTVVGNTYVKPFSITCMDDITKIIYGFINLQNYETNLTTCNKLQGFTLDVVYMNGKLINMPHNDQISKIEKMVNELFQSANNGKELIASAIGEPLNAEDTFSAMSNDINSLLSSFKTNMMNNGVTVESSDRFKSLIDKIATMVEEGSGKGIQFTRKDITLSKGSKWLQVNDLGFKANIVMYDIDTLHVLYNDTVGYDQLVLYPIGGSVGSAVYSSVSNFPGGMYINENGFRLPIFTAQYTESNTQTTVNKTITYYAIGVGEEDTTLRDSLASILTDEGVSVTEEDGMSSLISKVDEEFDRQVVPAGDAVASNVLSGKTFINSTGQTITGTMANRGGAQTITPGTSNKTLNSGYYSGNITVKGDSNLVAANIVSGKNIFGVAGSATVAKKYTSSTTNCIAYMFAYNSNTVYYTCVADGVLNIKCVYQRTDISSSSIETTNMQTDTMYTFNVTAGEKINFKCRTSNSYSRIYIYANIS